MKLGWICCNGVAGMMRRCWVCVVVNTCAEDVKGLGATYVKYNSCIIKRKVTENITVTSRTNTVMVYSTCLTVCAGTMGTDILTGPVPTTTGLAVEHRGQ